MRVAWTLALASVLGGTLVFAETEPATPMTFAHLTELTARQDVHSIEDVLPLLPDSFRKPAALVFGSRSLHASSARAPRVLLATPDARFIVTFNGLASQAGFEALETMEFNEASERFEFHEINFVGGRARISEPNPAKCTKCHGEPTRPVWDAYPSWPGVFGEREQADLSSAERAAFAEFMKERAKNPRYRHLVGLETLVDQDALQTSAKARYDGAEHMTANARLNLELEHLNFRMILRELSEHPRFRSYRYALLAALDANCETPDAFMSGGRDYASFARDTDRANAIQLGAKSSRSLSAGAGGKAVDAGTVSEKNALTRVRYVVEEGLGLSTANWTLALEKSTYDFSTPEIAMADLESLMFDRVVILDPDLRDWYATRDASDRYCHRLKAKSLAALRDLPPPSVPAPLVATKAQDPYLPKLIPKCASCHETGVGPRIPFTNPSALAHLLKAKGYRHGNLFEEIRFRLSIDAGRARMPLGENAEDGERTKLEHYLEALLRP